MNECVSRMPLGESNGRNESLDYSTVSRKTEDETLYFQIRHVRGVHSQEKSIEKAMGLHRDRPEASAIDWTVREEKASPEISDQIRRSPLRTTDRRWSQLTWVSHPGWLQPFQSLSNYSRALDGELHRSCLDQIHRTSDSLHRGRKDSRSHRLWERWEPNSGTTRLVSHNEHSLVGDGGILQLILKKFPSAPLDGTSSSNQGHTNLLHDEPRHLTKREMEAHENEMALFSTIRNDRADLLSILVQFCSFTIASFTRLQKRYLFQLCLLAEHRQVTVDKFNLKWLKHHSLRPCGSLACLRLLIEDVQFNPFDDPSSLISPFTIILEPIYLYLIELHHRLLLDGQMKFPPRLLRALHDLISKQISIFTYLVTHCCSQPTETDRIRLSECSHYIDEVFHSTEQYLFVRRIMLNLEHLLVKIQPDLQGQCLSLKEICRLNFRQSLRNQRHVLVQVEHRLCNLSASHKKYLKCLGWDSSPSCCLEFWNRISVGLVADHWDMDSHSLQEFSVASASSSHASRSFSLTIVRQTIFDWHESMRDGWATSSCSRCHASCQLLSATRSFSATLSWSFIFCGNPSAIHWRIWMRSSCNSSGYFWSSRMSALLGMFDDDDDADDLDSPQPIISDTHRLLRRAKQEEEMQRKPRMKCL